jgi:monoamine oxidase
VTKTSDPNAQDEREVPSEGTNFTAAPSSVSRRAAIAGVAVLAATAPVQAKIARAQQSVRARADVIVVGAGYAGLSAARSLVAHNRSVIVLEGNDRVGGRIWTKAAAGGAWIDMGGQWIGPAQDRIMALARSVGVATFPTYNEGKNLLYFQGKRAEYAADPHHGVFPVPARDLAEFTGALTLIDTLAKQVSVEDPARAPLAAEWDSQTVATWMRDNLSTAGAQFLMRVAILGYFAVEPRDMSFLHLLFYVRAAGGIEQLHTSGLAERFVGGAQEVCNRVANQLGSRVLLSTPVREIDQSGSTVILRTDQDRFEAQRVIVAVPPTLAARIVYRPALPPSRDAFTQRTQMGCSIKCHAVYPAPFWRDHGLSGQVISDETDVSVTYDNSPPSGSPGILVGFFEGQEAREWGDRSEADVRSNVLAAFEKFFGPQARAPIEFYQAKWTGNVWSGGCFSCVMPTGVWTAGYRDALRNPVDRVHWAGTETATAWYAYMDGAVASGEGVAAEVLQHL